LTLTRGHPNPDREGTTERKNTKGRPHPSGQTKKGNRRKRKLTRRKHIKERNKEEIRNLWDKDPEGGGRGNEDYMVI